LQNEYRAKIRQKQYKWLHPNEKRGKWKDADIQAAIIFGAGLLAIWRIVFILDSIQTLNAPLSS